MSDSDSTEARLQPATIQVLKIALQQAYDLLHLVVVDGKVGTDLSNQIRRTLPPRYPTSFSHRSDG